MKNFTQQKKFIILGAIMFIANFMTCLEDPSTDEIDTRRDNVQEYLESLPGYTLTVRKHVTHNDSGVGGTMSINGGSMFNRDSVHSMTLVEVDRNPDVEVCAERVSGYLFMHWSWNSTRGARIDEISNRPGCVRVNMDDDKTIVANFTPTRTFTVSSRPSSGTSNVTFSITGGSTLEQVGTRQYTVAADSIINVRLGSHSGFVFDNWSGDNITDENKENERITLTMTRDKALTAHFTAAFNLTVGLSQIGGSDVGGEITVVKTRGDDEPEEWQPSTFPNTTQHLVDTRIRACASVRSGYRFDGWSGDVNSDSLCVNVTMTQHRSLTARIVRQHRLTFSAVTNGMTDDPRGGTTTVSIVRSNGRRDTVTTRLFDDGTDLELCASPYLAFRFDGWSNLPNSSNIFSTATCTRITLNAPQTVYAIFDAPRLRITRTPREGGTVSVRRMPNGNVASYGPDDSNPIAPRQDFNSTVRVCAEPYIGENEYDEKVTYIFTGWSGDATGNSTCIELEMSVDREVTATFRLQ